MIYREYGQTGEKVSLLGFGGMRFKNVDDHDECVRMMVAAAEGGVNYFDTAPGYFGTKSETVFGKGLAELRRRNLPYFAATKTFESSEAGIRKEIEAQLKRLNIPAIDFYHIWCITDLNNWKERKNNGILQTFKKLKDEKLIRHICISSHLIKNEIKELLMEGAFEGVLFGYSAYNFNTRQEAFDAIKEKKLGAVVMNPMGGGVIPQHPELFGFMRREGESTVVAALRILWDHPEITNTLVGFETIEQVKEALQAMEGYKPRTSAELAEVKAKAPASFEGICTGCGYCAGCPAGVPIPQLMDAYNQKLLAKPGEKDPIGDRLYWHWDLERADAAKCTACGQCEKACTQHIDIIKRLKEIAG
ncbi:MAG: aldo/keto reductase [Treponema sp.]|jgi:predicted aldo/keto reductase-like oxidoreductase|nr:aldo/keto reductase [Treponema sp.]